MRCAVFAIAWSLPSAFRWIKCAGCDTYFVTIQFGSSAAGMYQLLYSSLSQEMTPVREVISLLHRNYAAHATAAPQNACGYGRLIDSSPGFFSEDAAP